MIKAAHFTDPQSYSSVYTIIKVLLQLIMSNVVEESFGDNRNVSDHFCLFLCLFLYSSVTAINNIVGVKIKLHEDRVS